MRGSPCPLWVRSGHRTKSASCPLYPRKQTSLSSSCLSASPSSPASHQYALDQPGAPAPGRALLPHRVLSLPQIRFSSPNLGREENMLRIFAIALFATVMSVGLADAKGHKHEARPKPRWRTVRTDAARQKHTCACGPAKMVCPKGMWCHSFASTCTRLNAYNQHTGRKLTT